jgi:hypothetical protein
MRCGRRGSCHASPSWRIASRATAPMFSMRSMRVLG